MKKILILSQVIPQWYVNVLTEALGDESEVEFVTGSKIAGKTIKSPEYVSDSLISKFISWARYFCFVRKWIRQNKNKSYDLIFATSNPPINSFLGLRAKKIFGAPFIMMNWDIYPQCIDYMIKNPIVHWICTIWHSLNSKNYPDIDKVITIGKVVAESINAPLRKKIDIEIIPIAVNTKQLIPLDKKENRFCIQNELQDKFVVLYSGKMGYGHNIELILEAAKLLAHHTDICFVFIGEGPKYKTVKSFCEKNAQVNIKLFPLQPDDMFPFSMACGDVGVVAEEIEMAQLFMPSKTYSMISCGMPVIGICSENDDLHNTIEENNIGCYVTDNSAQTLADIICELYENKEKTAGLKLSARDCAQNNYDVSVVTKQYKDLFDKYI